MRSLMRSLILSLTMVFLAMTFLGCSDSSDNSSFSADLTNRIYVAAAESGTLAPTENRAEFIISLDQVWTDVLWFTDRPERETGENATADFVGNLWPLVYGQVAPNAVIKFHISGANAGLFVALAAPEYDSDNGTLKFRATLLNSTFDEPPQSFLEFDKPVITILNNVPGQDVASSFVIYGENAAIDGTATEGRYTLTQEDLDNSVLLANNAPGRYSNVSTTGAFVAQWSGRFGDSPPNAVISGLTDTGELYGYLLTLTNPRYEETDNRITYSATVLGLETEIPATLTSATLVVDSAGTATRFPLPGKGTCYQAFSKGYDPSSANKSYIYFGSDIARKQTGSLWGTQSYLSESCGPNCRNDLQTIKDMGINLIRLYDWDNRNDHSQFLDYCQSLGIKVVVPISNYLPMNPKFWNDQVPLYLPYGNFGNSSGTDWHPAIAGIIIANEPYGVADFDHATLYKNAIGLVAQLLSAADAKGYSQGVPVGIPLIFAPRGAPFATNGADMPCWNLFNQLLTDPRVAQYKNQLMLCANTYNAKAYLFEDAEGTGRGWVQQTYEQFQTPILFTEIGKSRQNSDYAPMYVQDQLKSSITYQQNNPKQLLGACHFQFSDKAWKQTSDDSDSEGAFGAFHHGTNLMNIQCQKGDFDFFPDVSALNPDGTPNYGILTIDKLDQTSTYQAVVDAYAP